MKYRKEGLFSYFHHIIMEKLERSLKIWIHHRVQRTLPAQALLSIWMDLFCCWPVLFKRLSTRVQQRYSIYTINNVLSILEQSMPQRNTYFVPVFTESAVSQWWLIHAISYTKYAHAKENLTLSVFNSHLFCTWLLCFRVIGLLNLELFLIRPSFYAESTAYFNRRLKIPTKKLLVTLLRVRFPRLWATRALRTTNLEISQNCRWKVFNFPTNKSRERNIKPQSKQLLDDISVVAWITSRSVH